MHPSRWILWSGLTAFAWLPLLPAAAQSSSQPPASDAAPSASDLSILREVIDGSNEVRAAGDYESARAMAAEVVGELLANPPAERDEEWLELLIHAGQASADAQDAETAYLARKRVFEVRSATLSDEHLDLQEARVKLGASAAAVGEIAEARALFEKVHEIFARTLPDDHLDLQLARGNLGVTLQEQGDVAGALVLLGKALEVCSRKFQDDHPELQRARGNYAAALTAHDDHAEARALQERVLEVYLRTRPEDDPQALQARLNLATTLQDQGDLSGARAAFERVLEISSRRYPDDHPDLLLAREGLAWTLILYGDAAGARAVLERSLEISSRTLPEDHRNLQRTRMMLASALRMQGEYAAARALQEQVVEVFSRTLPLDHVDLQIARSNLAATLRGQGDLAAARAMEEEVLEVLSRTLPDDHTSLLNTRGSLVLTIARELARARHAAGGATGASGELEEGRKRCAELIDTICRTQTRAARAAILGSPTREAEERCAALAEHIGLYLSFALGLGAFEPLHELEAPTFTLLETTRGAAIASAELARRVASAPKYEELRRALREASEALAGLAVQGTTAEEFDRARSKRESVERELLALASELSGGTGTEAGLDVERLAGTLAADEALVSFWRFGRQFEEVVEEPDSTGRPGVRDRIVPSLCAFVLRRPESVAPRGDGPGSILTLVDLGPMASIEEAVHAWRAGLGAAGDSRGVAVEARGPSASDVYASGVRLRERILDPLVPALGGARSLVMVLDDVLHLVPLDALPLDAETLVGDRWRLEMRATASELSIAREALAEDGQLVAFGNVSYAARDDRGEGADPSATGGSGGLAAQGAASDVDAPAPNVRPSADACAVILRGSAWERGFAPLPGTAVEVRGIARCFAERFDAEGAIELRERENATRAGLMELAPRARYLHIATHGWFAPDSIRSWSDPSPLDERTGLGTRLSGAEHVKGMNPMLMCGLALAGANLPEDAVGRTPGLVTADELATLDLSSCELAVLSACETNIGERRSGQGVASLQKALHMAGAHSVITSLWKVPDEATKELMLDFYRRLWVEGKPKYQALWEAKTKLREARSESGGPEYATRDWAAWVLTGDPQ